MPTWLRLLLASLAWATAVVLLDLYADGFGAYQGVPLAMAAMVTGWLLSSVAGAALGAAAGAWYVFGPSLLLAGPAWRAVAQDGGLVLPVTLAVMGLVAGMGRRIIGQLRVHRDASERARFDPLTGVLNRAAFESHIGEWTARPRPGGAAFAVLFVDLDRFKVINDTYGHAVGDQLLQAVAGALAARIRQGDLLARLGGDEFVIALSGVRDLNAAQVVAEKVVERLREPFMVEGRSLVVSASVGLALYPRDGQDVATLTQSADSAMYAVKTSGKNGFRFSDHHQRERLSRRLTLEKNLRNVLHDQELEVAYQPQVRLADGQLVGFEALLRWNSKELGPVEPGEFIPVAEEAGLIVPIGHWLLREVASQVSLWSRWTPPDFRVAVNVSTLQFSQPAFVDQVRQAIADARVPAAAIQLEITESVMVQAIDHTAATLLRLEKLGVRMALDDFGTGYASLAYLQKLPIDTLKLARTFIAGLSRTSRDGGQDTTPIVDAIATMGHKLGKTVVAEGVENAAQVEALRRLDIQLAQGYYFGHSQKGEQAEALLKRMAGVQTSDGRARGGLRRTGSFRDPKATDHGLLLRD